MISQKYIEFTHERLDDLYFVTGELRLTQRLTLLNVGATEDPQPKIAEQQIARGIMHEVYGDLRRDIVALLAFADVGEYGQWKLRRDALLQKLDEVMR